MMKTIENDMEAVNMEILRQQRIQIAVWDTELKLKEKQEQMKNEICKDIEKLQSCVKTKMIKYRSDKRQLEEAKEMRLYYGREYRTCVKRVKYSEVYYPNRRRDTLIDERIESGNSYRYYCYEVKRVEKSLIKQKMEINAMENRILKRMVHVVTHFS